MPRRTILKSYNPPKRYIPKNVKHEESLQLQACRYLRLKHPEAIFRSDYASGLQLTMAQAVKHKRMQSGRSWPDIFIYQPRKVEGKQYAGLAIELKREGTAIILKTGPNKGGLVANLHIREQHYMLQELQRRGYYADFAVGLDSFINIVDWYFGTLSLENSALPF